MDKNSNKTAHKVIDQYGKEIAEIPGGNEVMGFKPQGPEKASLAAQAQSHLGNVDKSTNFAAIQRNAMKK
ncbi:hypothetical protein J6590_073418 [Homalodisca vitripennis]|nr:hypothetical protein J6590_073418 [Homalodisca vitripennis]